MNGSKKGLVLLCVLMTGTLLFLFQSQQASDSPISSISAPLIERSNQPEETTRNLSSQQEMKEQEDNKTEIEKRERKENFVFVKTHKCGTSTLVSMFYLYGVRRRSNFVLQRNSKNEGIHELDFSSANTRYSPRTG